MWFGGDLAFFFLSLLLLFNAKKYRENVQYLSFSPHQHSQVWELQRGMDGNKTPHPPTFYSIFHFRSHLFSKFVVFPSRKKKIEAHTPVHNHMTFFISMKVIPCVLLHLGIFHLKYLPSCSAISNRHLSIFNNIYRTPHPPRAYFISSILTDVQPTSSSTLTNSPL